VVNNMEDKELNKQIDTRIQLYLKGSAFTGRTLADTPTDAL